MHPRVHVLLVEDDEIDAEFMVRGFQHQENGYELTVVQTGLQALNVLRGQAGQSRLPRPCLIFADLNLPQMNGIEFLRELRQDPDLRRSVVFVLTTSNLETDKRAAYDYQVAGYVVKNELHTNFAKLLQLLDAYCALVKFPPECSFL